MKTVKLGFLGMGNIGSGVVRVLRDNGAMIEREYGVRFEIVRALVRDVQKAKAHGLGLPEQVWTTDPDAITHAGDIDTVVEVLGGEEPAASYMLRALEQGKTVVSANKNAVAPAWPKLDAAARKSGAGLYYEASVGGGVPIIDVLNNSMQANNITSIMGIINGTTNYMLWRMHNQGMDYAQALREAQELGYAEPDPTYDVSGKDAVFKLSILASLAFGKHVPVERIEYGGITEIAPQDIALGKALGMTLKLLGVGKHQGDTYQAYVYPTFLPDAHPMSSIQDAFNAIYFTGDMVGESMLFGRGAGALPTASAIVSDLVRAANAAQHRWCSFFRADGTADEAMIQNDAESAWFLRFAQDDAQALCDALTQAGLSVVRHAQQDGQCAVLVRPASQDAVQSAAQQAGALAAMIRAELSAE